LAGQFELKEKGSSQLVSRPHLNFDERRRQMERTNELADKVAKLEHLLSRNSGNSSIPLSSDGGPGRALLPARSPAKGRAAPKRIKGDQKGAPGANLSWSDSPDDRMAQSSWSSVGDCEMLTNAGNCEAPRSSQSVAKTSRSRHIARLLVPVTPLGGDLVTGSDSTPDVDDVPLLREALLPTGPRSGRVSTMTTGNTQRASSSAAVCPARPARRRRAPAQPRTATSGRRAG
jgi:hypothetical protein